MSKHFTRNTVSAAAWCNKCMKQTQHKVQDRRISYCLECVKRSDQERQTRPEKPAAKQEEMF